MTRARCPASTSNLGPGFDVLSLALNLYVEVDATSASSFEVHTEGEGSGIPGDSDHLVARVARHVAGHDHFHFHVTSAIPVARGLGSSAALAVVTAAALGAADPFAVAAEFDGHAENAAASVYGGLNAAAIVDGAPIARHLQLDERLSFVVVVPDRTLSTHAARVVLPKEVPFADAVSNLGRMGLLLAGLADADQLVGGAGVDRLHQDARAELFPEAPALLSALSAGGATIACWSGAGPSLVGICMSTSVAQAVQVAGEKALSDQGVPGRVLVLEPDLNGLVVEES